MVGFDALCYVPYLFMLLIDNIYSGKVRELLFT